MLICWVSRVSCLTKILFTLESAHLNCSHQLLAYWCPSILFLNDDVGRGLGDYYKIMYKDKLALERSIRLVTWSLSDSSLHVTKLTWKKELYFFGNVLVAILAGYLWRGSLRVVS